MRNTKSAFTLVELIVVITILAILGTIAFISLQGYSAEARDSKRLSDVASIAKKVSLQVAGRDAKTVDEFLGWTPAAHNMEGGTAGSTATATGDTLDTTNYGAGDIDFAALQESGADFKDPKGNSYVYAYATVSGGNYFQVAATLEEPSKARVVGNYVEGQASDVDSLISASTADDTPVTDGDTTDLPYVLQ